MASAGKCTWLVWAQIDLNGRIELRSMVSLAVRDRRLKIALISALGQDAIDARAYTG